VLFNSYALSSASSRLSSSDSSWPAGSSASPPPARGSRPPLCSSTPGGSPTLLGRYLVTASATGKTWGLAGGVSGRVAARGLVRVIVGRGTIRPVGSRVQFTAAVDPLEP
jgi:hypothetical protein